MRVRSRKREREKEEGQDKERRCKGKNRRKGEGNEYESSSVDSFIETKLELNNFFSSHLDLIMVLKLNRVISVLLLKWEAIT